MDTELYHKLEEEAVYNKYQYEKEKYESATGREYMDYITWKNITSK